MMRKMRLKYSRLNHIFISHLHGDHCLGLIGLLSSMALQGKTGSVTIHIFEDGARLFSEQLKFFCRDTPFEIKFNIDDEAMQRMVVPCTVQLLVENAFKHNIVSTSNPLRISISADMERLTIENNIQPKFTQTTSTKLGQKYIREHYNSLSKQQIVIDNSENLYRVTIPLL
jgi:ribonuclease BN (tRNA processing enzyme)